MAPDQTVRGRENEGTIWSGKFLPQVLKFSVINRSFPKSPEISGDFPVKNDRECAWWDRTHFLWITEPLLYPYTTTALCEDRENIK
jgi:hypothetical protein